MDLDTVLIIKMRRGDEAAVEIFVRRHYQDILGFCFRHLGGSDYAEDLTQETFQRFFLNLEGYRHYGKAKNYLYVIAGNLCKNFYKKKTEIALDEVGDIAGEDEGFDDEKMDVEQALSVLPEVFREVVILFYFQELKLKEIGAVLGIGVPLVKYRLRKAKELLREIMGEEYRL